MAANLNRELTQFRVAIARRQELSRRAVIAVRRARTPAEAYRCVGWAVISLNRERLTRRANEATDSHSLWVRSPTLRALKAVARWMRQNRRVR